MQTLGSTFFSKFAGSHYPCQNPTLPSEPPNLIRSPGIRRPAPAAYQVGPGTDPSLFTHLAFQTLASTLILVIMFHPDICNGSTAPGLGASKVLARPHVTEEEGPDTSQVRQTGGNDTEPGLEGPLIAQDSANTLRRMQQTNKEIQRAFRPRFKPSRQHMEEYLQV